MKEKILEAFKALGFELEELDESSYGFTYEGKNFLYGPTEDEAFLSIALPKIVDLEDVDKEIFYQAMDKLNSMLKYVKANSIHDSMWLFYERELLDEQDLKAVLQHMILHLDAGLNLFRKLTSVSDDEENENDDKDNDNTPI